MKNVHIKDFRDPYVWGPLLVALVCFLAEEWPVNVTLSPVTFFAGITAGSAMVRNSAKRKQGQPNKLMQSDVGFASTADQPNR